VTALVPRKHDESRQPMEVASMRKTHLKKLTLSRETVHQLAADRLADVGAAASAPCPSIVPVCVTVVQKTCHTCP
jgi:hypothetical protein